jgi:hypothetical protein
LSPINFQPHPACIAISAYVHCTPSLPFRKPLPQSPILGFQLSYELDKLPPLVPQEYQLLNLFGPNERRNFVDVVSGPFG